MYASAQNRLIEGTTMAENRRPAPCGANRAFDQPILRRSIMHILRIVAAIGLSLSAPALVGCQTTTSGGAVGADRRQLMLVSSQELDQVSAQAYNKLKADAAAKGTLNTDSATLRRVRAVAARIEPQTRVFRADAPGWKWEVNVINGNELNAYCMPGGKIMFYSGLIRQLSLSDDEIAVVMGHEIAHALREHSRAQVSQAMAAQTAIGLGAALFGLGQGSADMAGTAYQALIATRFSRNDENEADRIGLELTARAGYDPRAGVSLWQKMIKAGSGGRPPEFLSTHPTESSRVREIEALLPTVMPLYTAARRAG
jgi:Zn-dependent protease with chaperone function